MKNKIYLLIAFALAFLLFGAVSANAQGPQPGGKRAPNAPATGAADRLTYQGRVTNSSGVPLNSTVNMVFKLYDSANTLLWKSATRSVTPVNGLFTVYLGDGSDPDLYLPYSYLSAAFIGVTVGGDPELTPRQPLNTVYGYSDTYTGVAGSSNSGYGVYGISNSGYGVFGYSDSGFGVSGATNILAGAGVKAEGAGPSGTALEIVNGGIQVFGAGVGTSTPVFIWRAAASNSGGYNNDTTCIDNPLTNNNTGAILIVTHNYQASSPATPNNHPVGVQYLNSAYGNCAANRWGIFNEDGTAMTAGLAFNVMVIVP